MSRRDDRENFRRRHSRVLAFLSGNGPNPLPEGKSSKAGELETEFVNGVEADIRRQDDENNAREEPCRIAESATAGEGG